MFGLTFKDLKLLPVLFITSPNHDNKPLWCLKDINPTSGPKPALVIFLSAEWRDAQREEGKVVTQALGLCCWVAC